MGVGCGCGDWCGSRICVYRFGYRWGFFWVSVGVGGR